MMGAIVVGYELMVNFYTSTFSALVVELIDVGYDGLLLVHLLHTHDGIH